MVVIGVSAIKVSAALSSTTLGVPSMSPGRWTLTI